MKIENYNVYEEIKSNLASCQTKEDYEKAYKWLAEKFIEVNESAIAFENRAVEMLGEEQFGIVLYGSKEAYEKELAFEKKMNEAATEEERATIFMERIISGNFGEETPLPVLWPEDEAEIEDLAYAQ